MSEPKKQKMKADEFLHQSFILKSNGDLEGALQLLNRAISLAQEAGFETYPYEIQKELLLFDLSSSKDFSGLISVTARQLEDYRSQKNIAMQIDQLLTLAGLHIYSRDLQQCWNEIVEAENLLASITTEDFLRYSSQFPGISPERYHESRQQEINKIKEHLKNLKNN